MTTTLTEDETWGTLGVVVQLLHRAADQVWAAAGTDARSPLHSLGLGVFLVAAQVAELLPNGVEITGPDPLEDNPLTLLREAEQLTRLLTSTSTPAGLSAVVLAICDLVRETSDHDF